MRILRPVPPGRGAGLLVLLADNFVFVIALIVRAASAGLGEEAFHIVHVKIGFAEVSAGIVIVDVVDAGLAVDGIHGFISFIR